MAVDECIFCEIIAGREPATIVSQWKNAIAIVPLNPVVEGHLLVIPVWHVEDFIDDPYTTADTMFCAAELAKEKSIKPANLITSAGRAATQSVFHLHIHIVPRRENDGLALPWYSGRSRKAAPVSGAADGPDGGVEQP